MKKPSFWVVLAITLAHVILAFLYCSETPYRQAGIVKISRAQVPDIGAPDERQHANYIQTVMEGHLPVFDPKGANNGEHYEDHQPPAYYVLSAGWGKILGVSSIDAPEGIRLRWLNCLIGGASVVGVFFLLYWGYQRQDLGFAAAAVAALLPMNCALSGAISNDPLLICLCTWTLAICAKCLTQGWTVRLGILVGVFTGLAILTKTTAIALLPILLFVCFVKQTSRPSAKIIAAAAVSLLVLILPWFLRNQSLYGDPLAMGAFKQAFTGSPQAQGFIELYGTVGYWLSWVGWWTARSFFGVFGYMDIWLNSTGSPYGGDPNTLYRILIAATVLAGLAWLAGWKKEAVTNFKSVQWMLLIFAVLIKLSFLSFNMQYFQGQGRYLYPALGSIAAAIAVGTACWLKERTNVALSVYAFLLLATNIYALSILPAQFAARMGR